MEDRGELAQLEGLQAVTDAALAHLELDELLDELLMRIADILGVDTCAILLLDEQEQELVPRAAVGIEEEVERSVRIPLGRGFAGRVVSEGRPIILPDVEHADVVNPILREKGIKTLLGVPLLIEGRPIGVLHVGGLVPRVFDGGDVELLQLVADRAALAIEHAKLYEAERQARTRLEQLQAVTDVALAHLELDELLGELLPRIRDILEVDTCAVLLLDAEAQELVARAAIGIKGEVERVVRIPVGRGFAGRVAAERRPIVLDDVQRADIVNPILRERGIHSLLGVPLFVRDEVIGVAHVGSLAPRKFEQQEVELLQLVAERVALAIEKARLHEQMLRLDEMKMNFVAIASHELRTPATAVYGMLATLHARRGALPPAIQEELEESAYEQADRLRRLIEQLLDLSRLDAHAIDVQPRPVALHAELAKLVAAQDGDAEVRLEVDPSLAISVDPLVLDRVLSNLVANARNYGRPPICVSAARRDHHVRIAVEDHGDGVPAELVPQLFEPFARGHAGGAGLGLSIAKVYANAHGGDLLYLPSPSGARFELVIPQA